MSTSSFSILHHAGLALPVFTSLLGLLGIGGGIYNLISPPEGARGFGLSVPPAPRSSAHFSAAQRALIAVHGVRNIGSGLSLISLVLFWKFSSLCETSPFAELAVRRCIGISLTTGSVVGFGDAWLLEKFANTEGVGKEAKDLAGEKSIGHAVTAVVIAGMGLTYLLY